ncbi:hypothetical protein T439DRAFT_323039 [Meredithblackwellia eburnea MCA 4105]
MAASDETIDNPFHTLLQKFINNNTKRPHPHIQHKLIKARRADEDLSISLATNSDDIDAAWIRLRGRLEDLEEALLSDGTAGEMEGARVLAADVRRCIVQIQSIVRQVSLGQIKFLSSKQVEELQQQQQNAASDGGKLVTADGAQLIPSSSSAKGKGKYEYNYAGRRGGSSPFDLRRSPLAKNLDMAYTTYLLAVHPESILPPGKTLASALHTQPALPPPPPPSTDTLEFHTRQALKDARYSSYVKRLETGVTPGQQKQQMDAWLELRAAVWGSCSGLIPERLADGQVKSTFEAEFTRKRSTPTEYFVLKDSIDMLHRLAVQLSQLCSPVRDPEIEAIINSLSTPVVPTKLAPEKQPTRTATTTLSALEFVKAISNLVDFADKMASDLITFKSTVKSAVSDEFLVRVAAGENERNAILSIYDRSGTGEDFSAIKESTMRWIDRRGGSRAQFLAETTTDLDRGNMIASALVDAIFEDDMVWFEDKPDLPAWRPSSSAGTVAAGVPRPKRNALPAILVVPQPAIQRLQNFVQGIIIAACLSSLAAVPAARGGTALDALGDDFASRVWALLKADIDFPPAAHSMRTNSLSRSLQSPSLLSASSSSTTSSSSSALMPTSTSGFEEIPSTHLGDLADEVIRIRRLAHGDAATDEELIRGGVNRIVRYNDPVFRLLKGRVKEAIQTALRTPVVGSNVGVPVNMATGIVHVPAERKKGGAGAKKKVNVPAVKGFARQPFLMQKLAEFASEVHGVVQWSAEVWGDRIGFEVAG